MIRAPHLGRSGPQPSAGAGAASAGNWFAWVARALFAGETTGGEALDRALVDEVIDAIVDVVEPRIRLQPRYRARLAPGVRRSIIHLRALARDWPESLVLAPAAWSEDRRVSTWFATPDRVRECLGEGAELRGWFNRHAAADELCALLAMRRDDRTVLGHALRGDLVVSGVQQRQVSFSEHRLLAPGDDAADSRREVGRRILLRLAGLALEHILAEDRDLAALEEQRAMLGMRLRMARLERDGAGALTGKPVPGPAEIQALERELAQVSKDYLESKRAAVSFDRHLTQIDAIFSQPEQYVALERTRLRVDRMGIERDATDADAVEIELAVLRLGDGLSVAIAPVRVARSELPPETDAIGAAARALGLPG